MLAALMRRLRAFAATWGVVVVRGRSMQPTVLDGDRLVVQHGATPRAGQLAVKRATLRQRVGDGSGWWIERDNPAEGVDSWRIGAIPDHDVVAVVRARLWPQRKGRLRHR